MHERDVRNHVTHDEDDLLIACSLFTSLRYFKRTELLLCRRFTFLTSRIAVKLTSASAQF